jgi:disulfide bond formation protein DsbB
VAEHYFSGENSNRANTAFMIGLFTILAALCFEYIGHYIPCELCLGQRIPYYIGLPALAVIIAGWKKIPVLPRIAATFVVACIFIWGTYLGTFHAGVEWGFWPGPTACTGTGGGIDFGDLNNINETRVVPCDQPQIRFFDLTFAHFPFDGFSFAGLNAIISALISGFLLWSVEGQYTRYKKERSQ